MAKASSLTVLGALAVAMATVVPAAGRERAAVPGSDLRPCPGQGAGFVRVPGSATCLRLSGRVAAGIAANRNGAAPLAAGRLAVDTRTATDYGPVRAFVRMGTGRH